MLKSKRVALLALVFCCACASEAPPPPVDHQADEQRIRQLTQDWYAAETRKDLETIMGFMAETIVAQFPGMPLLEGKEAVRQMMATLLEPMVSSEEGTMTIVVSQAGDMAYQYGTSTLTFNDPSGEVIDPEKYLFVWEKIDGDWKVVAGSSSSDVSM